MISGSASASSSSSIVRNESASEDLLSAGLAEPSEASWIQALILRENSRLRRNSARARRCSDVSTKGCRRPRWSYCTVLAAAAQGE